MCFGYVKPFDTQKQHISDNDDDGDGEPKKVKRKNETKSRGKRKRRGEKKTNPMPYEDIPTS